MSSYKSSALSKSGRSKALKRKRNQDLNRQQLGAPIPVEHAQPVTVNSSLLQITNCEFSFSLLQSEVQVVSEDPVFGPELKEAGSDYAPVLEANEQASNCLSVNVVENKNYSSIPDDIFLTQKLQQEIKPGFEVSLAKLVTKHQMTNACVEELLKLLKITEEEDLRSLPKSIQTIDDRFRCNTIIMKIGYVCYVCSKCVVLEYSPDCIGSFQCCERTYGYNDDHFVLLDTTTVLRYHLPVCWEFRDCKLMPCALKQKFLQLGLKFDSDFSITLNLDGVPIFSSSGTSIWPILGYVDSCPFKIIKTNVILFGVYVGKVHAKPNFACMLSSVLQDFQKFRNFGFRWKSKNHDHDFISKCIVSKVLCDSMARPPIQCIQQFNGLFGCGFCLHKEGGHYFRHLDPLPPARENTTHRTLANRTDFAWLKTEVQLGVTGASSFLQLEYMDIINDFPPDAMHCVYLGVTKQLLLSMLSDFNTPYYLGGKTKAIITKRLSSIQPPYRVSRLSKSLDEINFWKSHQWSMWLLYYSAPILCDVLPKEYFDHWIKLVFSIALLSSSSLTNDAIHTAKWNIEEFSKDMLRLYGDRNCTFNVHLLRHLPHFCELFGPLFSFSMIPFENYNSELKSFVKGTQSLGIQIAKKYRRQKIIQYIEASNKKTDSTISSETFRCSPDYIPMWVIHDYDMHECNRHTLLAFNITCYFTKLKLLNGRKFYSEQYQKVTTRNSYSVLLKSGNVAKIKVFFLTSDGKVYALVDEYRVFPAFQLDHIFIKSTVAGIKVVSVEEFVNLVLCISVNSSTYYSNFINNVENINE